jgi:hypothetical protein
MKVRPNISPGLSDGDHEMVVDKGCDVGGGVLMVFRVARMQCP